MNDWRTGGWTGLMGDWWWTGRLVDGRLGGRKDSRHAPIREGKKKDQFSSTFCHDLTLRHPVRSGGVQKTELLQTDSSSSAGEVAPPRYPASPLPAPRHACRHSSSAGLQ